jgi:MoxR-like ATPase
MARAIPLPENFTVFATQNPIEFEGTYPLPEAQLDRFLLNIHVGYPSAEDEIEILTRYETGFDSRRVNEINLRPARFRDCLPRHGESSNEFAWSRRFALT